MPKAPGALPPPPPNLMSSVLQLTQSEQRNAAAAAAGGMGFGGTIKTSPQGAGKATTATKTLLGS